MLAVFACNYTRQQTVYVSVKNAVIAYTTGVMADKAMTWRIQRQGDDDNDSAVSLSLAKRDSKYETFVILRVVQRSGEQTRCCNCHAGVLVRVM